MTPCALTAVLLELPRPVAAAGQKPRSGSSPAPGQCQPAEQEKLGFKVAGIEQMDSRCLKAMHCQMSNTAMLVMMVWRQLKSGFGVISLREILNL